MKRSAWTLVLVVLCSCSPQEQQSAPTAELTRDLWVNLEDAWQPAPKESGVTGFVPARVLRFEGDGNLALIECALLRSEREIFISPGDGLAFYFGTWRAAKDGYAAEYVKVDETVHASKTGLPYERKLTASFTLDAHGLVFDGVRFQRQDAPVKESYDSFADPLRKEHAAHVASFLKEH